MPKFQKGSQEAKDYMKSLREKRGPPDPEKIKKNKEKRQIQKINKEKLLKEVEVPLFASQTLVMPEYMAVRTKKGFKLVNPLTQERNLSTRKGETAIKLLRKPVKDMILLEGIDMPIPMKLFSKKDRELIDKSFENADLYKSSELDVEDLPDIKMPKPKPRGRPEILKKNVEHNKRNPRNPPQIQQNEEIQNHNEDIEIDNEEPQNQIEDEEQQTDIGRRGRKKHNTEAERYQAKLLSNKLKRQEKKANENVAPSKRGKAPIYKTDAERYQAKLLSNKLKRREKKENQGEGIMDKFKYIKTVLNGRNDYPPKVRGIIEKYGNQEIKSIVIRRNPLQSIMNFALNAVSLGGWNKNMEDKPYDTLFHLSIVLTLNNNTRVVLEKNEVINMDTIIKVAPKTETEDIPDIQPGLTLNTLLNNAKNRMGSKYFTYSAKDNNCQDFILAVLQANNIGNEEDYSFVKQDTKSLFEGLSTLRKVSNSITDLGAKINEITTGAGLKNNISFDIKMPRRKKCDIADSEGGNILKDMRRALNPRRNGVAKAFRPDGPSEKFGRKLGSVAIHQVLPGVIQETTSALVTGASGNPILGTVVGNTLGQYAGQKAGDALGKSTGMGFSRKARFVKGSDEAKDFMARLRAKRNK